MQRRRLLTTLPAATLAALALGSCSTPALPGRSSPITLEYWAWNATQEPLVHAWNEMHPDIQVRHTDAGGGDDSAAKLVTASRAGNAPDVALVEYPTLPSLMVAGAVAEITEHVTGVDQEYVPGVWSLTSFDGATYGIPIDAGPQSLTYNKRRLDELGISVPTTWDEFAEAAAQVRASDDSSYICSWAPGEFGNFAGYAQQAGAHWWDGRGAQWTIDIAGDESLEVADFWQDLIDRDLVSTQPLLTPEWNAQLNNGQILSWPGGMWAAGVISGVAADMAGDWALAPLPQRTPGDEEVGFEGGSCTVVTTSSEHPEAAAQFATWLGIADEACRIQIEHGQYPASLRGQELTLESPPPTFMGGQSDYWEVAAQIAENTLPQISWGPNVNVANTAFQDAMSSAVNNGTPLSAGLETVESIVINDMRAVGYEVTER